MRSAVMASADIRSASKQVEFAKMTSASLQSSFVMSPCSKCTSCTGRRERGKRRDERGASSEMENMQQRKEGAASTSIAVEPFQGSCSADAHTRWTHHSPDLIRQRVLKRRRFPAHFQHVHRRRIQAVEQLDAYTLPPRMQESSSEHWLARPRPEVHKLVNAWSLQSSIKVANLLERNRKRVEADLAVGEGRRRFDSFGFSLSRRQFLSLVRRMRCGDLFVQELPFAQEVDVRLELFLRRRPDRLIRRC